MVINYVGKNEPDFKDVVWYYPASEDTFEVRMWGAQGWKPVSNTDYSVILAINLEKIRAESAEGTIQTTLDAEIIRATNTEDLIARDLETVSLRLNSRIELIEQEAYDALTSYGEDTIYLIYTPKLYTLVDKPINRSFTYDGTIHTLVSTEAYTVIGSGSSEVGVYRFTISLNYNSVTNTGYKWSDGTENDIVVTYTIYPEIVNTTWHFGDTFPIRFSPTIWYFGDKFPIKFS